MEQNNKTVQSTPPPPNPLLPNWCLLCFSPSSSSHHQHSNNDSFAANQPSPHQSQLSTDLHVIFLLKNCLDLPTERLSYYLYKWGSPRSWVTLCSECSKVIKDARTIHSNMLKLREKFDELKLKVVEILKGSGRNELVTRESKEYKKQGTDKKKAMEVTEMTRGFVRKHEFRDHRNPFVSGDRQADDQVVKSKLSCIQASSNDRDVEVEEEHGGALASDYDDGDGDSSCGTSSDSDELSEESSDDDDGSGGSEQDETERKLKQGMLTSEGKGKKKKNVEEDLTIRCRVCNKQFGTTEFRDAHEQVHKKDLSSLRHKCPFCPQAYSRLDYYRIHLRSHKVQHDKPKITKEDRQFAKAQERERKRLEKQRKYACSECDQAFPKLKLLEAHLIELHGGELVPVVCDLCGKSFARELSLRKHVKKVHETERKYNLHCIHCSMGMKTPGKLKRHLKEAHNVWEVDQYVCEVEGCKKKYQLKVDYEVHMAKHSGQAPYQCEHCGKDFWQSQQIRKHAIVMHSGNRESKPYKCDVCGKGFAIKHYVYTHKRKVHLKKGSSKVGVGNFGFYESDVGSGSSGGGGHHGMMGTNLVVVADHDYGRYGGGGGSSSGSGPQQQQTSNNSNIIMM